uniref:Uncharacterized protein n=1 Tax=Cucumis melo TaxID=3656 RepID=A0A9I9EAH4_CUCME
MMITTQKHLSPATNNFSWSFAFTLPPKGNLLKVSTILLLSVLFHTTLLFLLSSSTLKVWLLWSKAQALLKWNSTPNDVKSLAQNICSLNIKTQKGLITFNTIAILLWKIWLERNNRIFKQQKKEFQDLWEDILAQTGLWSCKSKLFSNYDCCSIALNISAFVK